jgi:ribosome biogenesis GTPase / thiamine phosphate phosphatase
MRLRARLCARENATVYELSALGFGPFFAQQIPSNETALPARIAAEHRSLYEIWTAGGDAQAVLAGKLRSSLSDERLPCVGDWVLLKDVPSPASPAVIERVLERRSEFSRGAAGRGSGAQAVAANVDLVFAVCGLDADFNLHRIERFVARIWAGGAQPVVVLNKADLCDQASPRASETARRCPGVPVLVTSVKLQEGLAALRAAIRPGETAALAGSSGVGKSSLINALLGEELMRTAATRLEDGRGRHTTTHRQLLMLPQGGLLIDTPGMRELQLIGSSGLSAVFEDIAGLARNCRFRDCSHNSEPGCAVRAAVEAGQIPAERLAHYRKLDAEAAANERRRDARLHRQDERAWGKLTREGGWIRRKKESLD